MKKIIIISCISILIVCLIGFIFFSFKMVKTKSNNSNESTATSTKKYMKPFRNVDKKWRIGYCESEPYSNYAGTLYYILKGLHEYGWIDEIDDSLYREGQSDTRNIWDFISKNNISEFIEFPEDGYYIYSQMNSENGILPEDNIINRLNTKKDVDIMLVMGTVAGKALANDKHNVPTMVFSASNAYNSGIVKGIEKSNNPHVWAHMDKNRFKRQLYTFDDIFKIKKLGLVYEDSKDAKEQIELNDIEEVALERGFKIEREFVENPKSNEELEKYKENLVNAYKRLSNKVDSLYLTVSSIDVNWLPDLLKPLYSKKLKFSPN